MRNHHLFFSLFLILIIIYVTSSYECEGHANQDDTPFDTKIHQSASVLIGTSLNKNIDINIPNLFNVTFLVRCILKGRPTQRIIHIVQAGLLLGRRSCQRLNVNRDYIVFLDPFFDGTYRPVDFEEIPYNNQMNMLLEKTCGLSRTYPFTESNDTDGIFTNRCPSAVSTDCPIGLFNKHSSQIIFMFIETSKTTVVTSTANSVSSTTNSIMFGKDSMDLKALSLLLAEHQRQNLSFAFLQSQTHKGLFSDDDVRQNQASPMICSSLIQFIFCSIFCFFLVE
jgi:hypothetical protein